MGALDILVLSYLIISYVAGILVSINIILENRDPAKPWHGYLYSYYCQD